MPGSVPEVVLYSAEFPLGGGTIDLPDIVASGLHITFSCDEGKVYVSVSTRVADRVQGVQEQPDVCNGA